MEILFRGKRIDNGEWIEGYFTTDTQIAGGKEKTRFLIGNDWDYYEIVPKSLGMFTGLTDKNGVKIFGKVTDNGCGDILRGGWFVVTTNCEVVFGEYDNSDMEYGSDGNIGFYVENKHGHQEGLNNSITSENIEVIGNPFDNPDLLKKTF